MSSSLPHHQRFLAVFTGGVILLASQATAASTVRSLMDLTNPGQVPASDCPVFPSKPKVSPSQPSEGQQELKVQLAQLERQLEQMPKDSEQYKMISGVLSDLKKRLSEAPLTTSLGKTTAYRKLSTSQALANLYFSLADHLSPEAWAAWVDNRELAKLPQANQTAVVAVNQGKPLLAVAAYLKVLEAQPKERDALFNLASLAAALGAPNEALALLDASVAQGGPRSTFYPPAAQVLTVRGYALLWVNRSKEAEAFLTQAVKIAPNLVEAQRNLAAAQANQGKCGQARAVVARSQARHNIPKKAEPATTTPLPPGPVPIPIAFPTGDQTDDGVSLRDVLDFGRATFGEWPYWPTFYNPYDDAVLDRRAAEIASMQAKLDSSADAAAAQQAPAKLRQLYQSVASEPLTAARVRLLYTGQFQLFREKKFRGLLAQLAKDITQYDRIYEGARRNLQNELDVAKEAYSQRDSGCRAANTADPSYCLKKAEYDWNVQSCLSVVDWNDQWKGSASFLIRAVKPVVTELDLFYSTVIAYASLPLLQEELRRPHRMLRKSFLGIIPGYLSKHLGELDRLNAPCEYVARVKPPQPVPEETEPNYKEFTPRGCLAPNLSLTAKVGILQMSMSCEKVSVALAIKVPLKEWGIFGGVEVKTSKGGSTSNPPTARDRFIKAIGAKDIKPVKLQDFDKPNGWISTFIANASAVSVGVGVSTGSAVAGNGVSIKDSLFLTVSTEGEIIDVGLKGETALTAGGEMDLGAGKVGVGVKFTGVSEIVSFMPSAPVH